ncbi:golgin-84 [Prorops nasuta]|uniref:golgin-84 n=1 Tax=Prorops nasuta TaxID=863751 RepID=UPI0034CF9EBD
MAWLSGLAGKAENLLNKIDQNTAAVLKSPPTEIKWTQPDLNEIPSKGTDESFQQLFSNTKQSISNLNSINQSPVIPSNENELLTYLNIPSSSPKRIMIDSVTSSTPSSLFVEHSTESIDSISEISIHSGHDSPSLTQTFVDVPENESVTSDKVEVGAVYEENSFYENIQSEMLRNGTNKSSLNYIPEKSNPKRVTRLDTDYSVNSTNYEAYMRSVLSKNKCLEERNRLMGKQETDHQKQIIVLNEELESLENEKLKFLRQIEEMQVALDRNRVELSTTRSELELHKARALKTLQEKEKLIAELKLNTISNTDETTIMELNQLRQEREALREENQHISKQLQLTRDELAATDMKLEKFRQKSAEATAQAQEFLASERHRRIEAEEDAKLHAEEIRSLKEELIRQRSNLSVQISKQSSELSRLRMQLSAISTPSSEIEARLATLTQTLVQKQQALEHLTTERNALRLQLEKTEHEFRTGNSKRNCYNNINDTDDAKAQVPTFLLESPFDTGVTRRVKRAYSTLDAISIRTGVFLRRYPLARILVLIYMAILQLWVLFVLLSQSPEAH